MSGMRGLIIRSPWIEKILAGQKTWEIRGSRTKIRERIGLIRGGSGLVVGTCDLTEVVGPLSLKELKANARKIGLQPSDLNERPYKTTYAWVMRNPKKFKKPKPYRHPSGAVIWVNLKGLR
jgi:hypothetical protein